MAFSKMKHIFTSTIGLLFLVSCSDKNKPSATELTLSEEVTVFNELSRRSWMAGLEHTYSELERNGSKDTEFVLKRIIQCCIYDTALEFGDGNVDTRLQWKKLKGIQKAGLLPENRISDPLFLNEHFEKYPNKGASMLNLSEKVTGDKDSYNKYCEWFKKNLEK